VRIVATAEADIAIGNDGAAWVDRIAGGLTSSAFVGTVLAVLAWPIVSILPGIGPDPSWAAGLYMAHGEGLQFGRDFVFTYGPLGFLQAPVLYDEAMWIVAFLFQVTIHVGVAVSLLWAARRFLPLAVAAAACYCLLVIGGLTAAVVLLAFVWCFIALGDDPPRFVIPLVTIGGGILAAVELLAKANYGIAIFAFALLVVFGLPDRRRRVPLFLAIACGSFAVGWVLAGQALAGVPDFVIRAAEVVSGYSAAMGTDIAAVGWERPAAIAVGVLLMASAALAMRDAPWPRRVASLALVAVFWLMTFKQGFVRQGLGNTPEFFVMAAGAGLAVASRLPRAPFRIAPLALTAPLLVLALVVLPTPSLLRSLEPRPHLEFMRQGLDALLRSGKRQQLISEGRRAMRSSYRLDPGILKALQDRPVHIDPWEIGVAWAYRLDWHPLPVIQSYSAYTPQLDRLNAEALSGPQGPMAILRHRNVLAGGSESSIDDRFPGWESPAAMRTMLCHYRVARTTARWQLLERSGDRCGLPRAIGVVHSMTGEPIPIPPPPGPHDLVFARIDGIGVEGLENLRTVLYRARERTVTLGAGRAWKLVPATAGDGLIMRASPGVDYPRPFRLAPDVRAMSLRIEGVNPRPIAVRFFAQAVRPSQGPA
jgi:hypothetical protein